MKTVFRGKVVRGKVVVEGTPPPNGSVVTVYVEPEDVWVTPEQARLLEEAAAQCDRGESFTWEQVKERLRKRRLARSSSSPQPRTPTSRRPRSGGS